MVFFLEENNMELIPNLVTLGCANLVYHFHKILS